MKLALTAYVPLVLLAVSFALAMPAALVVTVMLALPLLNVPLAPLAGAVNVTLMPLTGLPNWSVTVATNGPAKVVPAGVLWLFPPVAAMAAGGLLVRLKAARLATPVTVAVTL